MFVPIASGLREAPTTATDLGLKTESSVVRTFSSAGIVAEVARAARPRARLRGISGDS
jgi:hypothetical protein